MPLYFGANRFKFTDLDAFYDFAQIIGSFSRWQLRKVHVNYDGQAPTRAMKLMVQCMGIKELEIGLHGWSFAKPPVVTTDLKLFAHKELLRIRGLNRLEVNFDRDFSEAVYPDTGTTSVTRAKFDALVESLQILKQPHSPRFSKKQEAKDFPQKAERTSYGNTNVSTRSERRMQKLKGVDQ